MVLIECFLFFSASFLGQRQHICATETDMDGVIGPVPLFSLHLHMVSNLHSLLWNCNAWLAFG